MMKRVGSILAVVLATVSVWSFAGERGASRVPDISSHYLLQFKVLSASPDKGLVAELKSFEQKARFLLSKKDGEIYVLKDSSSQSEDGSAKTKTTNLAELRSNVSLSEWRAVDGHLEIVFFPGKSLEKGAFIARIGKTEPLCGTYTLQGGW